MKFRKYMHIERFGTDEVEGIELGEILVFYKLDGTNGSIWLNNGQVFAGSRTRELSLERDNAGFYRHVLNTTKYERYLKNFPKHRLFGEWLVPHSLKTYRQDAWKKFYVFDVVKEDEEQYEYLHYDGYQPLLEEFDIEYIPPLARFKSNTNYESLIKLLDKTGEFLVEDGKGNGEGIVIKNYSFYNRYGRQTWAKIVSNEFKEKHKKKMGPPNIASSTMTEERIIEALCTEEFIRKEYQKIVVENDGWQSKFIPMLLGKVFHEFVKEECWNFVKKYKNPTVNFKTLNHLLIAKIKTTLPEVFS